MPPSDPLLDDFFGPATPEWVPDANTDATRRNVDVPLTRLYGDPLFGKPRGVKFDQGLNGWVRLVLTSAVSGAPVVVDIGSYSEAPTIDVRIVEASGCDPRVYEPNVPAELVDSGRVITFQVPPEVANSAGIYRVQVRVVTVPNGVEAIRDEFWLYVDRGFWTTDNGIPADKGPPTLAEVRTSLRDHPAANRLLGEYEFDVAEVGFAVVSAVQRFNNELPPLPHRYQLTTIRLPGIWRRQMLNGSLTYLLETAVHYFQRGNLPYTAGGLAVNDLAKDKDYQSTIDKLRADFERWIRLTRTTISISAAWGSTGSNYPNSIY